MKEIFYEESASLINFKSEAVKFNLLKVFSILSYVLLGVWLMIMMHFPLGEGSQIIISIILILIPSILFVVTGIIFGKVKNRFCVEYDYTFVSGSIRFSKVIKNNKRKFIVKFECSDIEKIGKVGSETFEKYYSMPGVSKSILTGNATAMENKDFYYLVVNIEGDKRIYIIECTETFFINILKFTSKRILEEDFK